MANGGRSAVDELLGKARRDLDRVLPLDLAEEVAHATDLVGGFQALLTAGLVPRIEPSEHAPR